MIKELETLNDFVDGYLGIVYDEPAGNLQSGKVDFLNKFRNYLASVPSNKEGDELIKILNRGLLKASTLPVDFSLNKKKGFEEALSTIQDKIKELFNLEDLTTGTIQHYLQDIPKINMPKKKGLPSADTIFDAESGDPVAEITKLTDDIGKNIDEQLEVLERHALNNGKLIVLSDEGYTDLGDMESEALKGLIESTKASKKQLRKMVETAVLMIRRYQKGKDDKNDGTDDFLKGLLGGDPDDEK